jgi:hypothetical protein
MFLEMELVTVNKKLLIDLFNLAREAIISSNPLITRADAAELLCMSKQSIANLVKLGRLEEVEGPDGRDTRYITNESLEREIERRNEEGIKKRGRLSKRDIERLIEGESKTTS